MIEAYRARWDEMLGDASAATLAILHRLREGGMPVYALSNWSAETFNMTRARFPFLDGFDGLLISGEVGLAKPDPAIFRLFLDRFGLEAGSTLFIDDSPANVAAARALGIWSIGFVSPAQLERDLAQFGLPS